MRPAPAVANRSPTPGVADADFESFYVSQRVRLLRALVVVTRDVDAAEEVAQSAFINVWERWDRISRMDDPEGYLYRTALHEWFQLHRRALRSAKRVAAHHQAIDPLESVENRDVLSRTLLGLPARQRAALVLTEYLGYDSVQAGRVMGIRPGTVRRLVSLGRATLRHREAEGEEP